MKRGTFLLLAGLLIFLCLGCGGKEKKTAAMSPTPANMPNVPLYPSGKVVERTYGPDGSFQVRLVTMATREDIITFYDRRLSELGWGKDVQVSRNESLLIYRLGESRVYLTILPTDDPDQVIHILTYKE